MAPRKSTPPRRIRAGHGDFNAEVPSLLELERFSTSSIARWRTAHEQLGRLHTALFFGLESARRTHGQALIDAVRATTRGPFKFSDWSRIVDWKHGLRPLSCAGSIQGEGGRFNIGGRLDPGAFTAFPALYAGDSEATAYTEKFQQALGIGASGFTGAELGLRTMRSFTQCRLRGRLDQVLDVGDVEALKPLVEILRTFALPGSVNALARRLGLRRPPALVRSAGGLQKQLLTRAWRILPMQFDLPANSQVFGRLVAGAGIHGILYPSARHAAGQCLALFPQNWAGSESYVEVMDAGPEGADLVRLDRTTGAAF